MKTAQSFPDPSCSLGAAEGDLHGAATEKERAEVLGTKLVPGMVLLHTLSCSYARAGEQGDGETLLPVSLFTWQHAWVRSSVKEAATNKRGVWDKGKEGSGEDTSCCTIAPVQVQSSSCTFRLCGAGLPHWPAALGSWWMHGGEEEGCSKPWGCNAALDTCIGSTCSWVWDLSNTPGTDFPTVVPTVVLSSACRIFCPSLLCKRDRMGSRGRSMFVTQSSQLGETDLGEGRGSVQICGGCACGKWRLHVAVPNLWWVLLLCEGVLSASQQTQADFSSSCLWFFFSYHSHKSCTV